jgi:hypothetical protein
VSFKGTSKARRRGVEGTGSIPLLFWDVDVDFSHTWGDKEDTRLPPTVIPLLAAEFEKVESWTAELADANHLVTCGRSGGRHLVRIPSALKITQRAVPLGLTLDKFGSQRPDDASASTSPPRLPAWTRAKRCSNPSR